MWQSKIMVGSLDTRYKLNVAQADLAWFDLSLDDTEMPTFLS